MSNSDIHDKSRGGLVFLSESFFVGIVRAGIGSILICMCMFLFSPIYARAAGETVTYPVYHVHSGNSSSGGGCYGEIVGYDREPRYCGGSFITDWGVGYGEKYYCNRCGAWGGPDGNCEEVVGYDESPIYGLNCGHGSNDIVGYVTYTLNTTDWTKDVYVNMSYESQGMTVGSRPYIMNGTSYDNGKFHFTENGNYTFSLATDGNSDPSGAIYTLNINNIDNTSPMIVSYTLNPTNWVKEGVTLNMIDVRDPQPDGSAGSGLHESAYSYDNGATWTAASSHFYTENGNYTVTVRDKAGNTSSSTFTISNIDREVPRITGINYDHTPNLKNVTVDFSCDDQMPDGRAGSGLDSSPYSYDGGRTWTASRTYRIDHNGTIDFKVRDKLGNTSSRSVTVSNIDDTVPTVSHSLSDSEWTQGPVTVIFSASDKNPDGSNGTGLPADCFSYDGGSTWTSNNSVIRTENGTVSVKVKDKNGNIADLNVAIKNIDHTVPKVIRHSFDPTVWVKDGVTLRLDEITDKQPDGSNGCGMHSKPYSYDEGNTWTENPSFFYTENGNYKVYVRDNLINTCILEITIDNIDHEAPRITSLEYNETANLKTVTLCAKCDDILSDGREGCGLDANPYSYDGGNTWTDKNTLVIEHNGDMVFKVRDKLGNTASQEVHIKNIDDYDPQLSHSVSDTAWSVGPVDVIFTGTDNNSDGNPGVGLPDDCYSYDGGITWTDKSVVTMDDNGVIDVLIKDKNGNTTGDRIEIRNIDHTVPTVDKYTLDPAEAWVKEGVKLTLNSVTDPQPDGSEGCGLNGLPYSYDDGRTWTDDNTYFYDENGDKSVLIRDALNNTYTLKFNISNIDHEMPRIIRFEYDDTKNIRQTTLNVECDDILSDGRSGVGLSDMPYSYDGGLSWTKESSYTTDTNGRIDFLVRDRLGNTDARTIIIDFIDEFCPEVSHSLYPSFWTNRDVEVSFEAADINPDGSEGIGIPDRCYSYDSGRTWTDEGSVILSENGYVQVAIRDKHDNINYYSLDVVNIDKNAPAISASYDLISGQKAAMLTVKATDDASGIDYDSITWSGPEAGSGASFITGTDGIYTVTVHDRAGNTAEAMIGVTGIRPSLLHPNVDRVVQKIKETVKKRPGGNNESKETVEVIMPKISEKGNNEILKDINEDTSDQSLIDKIIDRWSSLTVLQKILIILAASAILAGLVFLLWLWFRSVAIYCDLGDGTYRFLGFKCIHFSSGNPELTITQQTWEKSETTRLRLVCNLIFVAFHRGDMLYVYFPEGQIKSGKIAHKMDVTAE